MNREEVKKKEIKKFFMNLIGLSLGVAAVVVTFTSNVTGAFDTVEVFEDAIAYSLHITEEVEEAADYTPILTLTKGTAVLELYYDEHFVFEDTDIGLFEEGTYSYEDYIFTINYGNDTSNTGTIDPLNDALLFTYDSVNKEDYSIDFEVEESVYESAFGDTGTFKEELPVRLLVQSQYGDIVIPLEYGDSSGVIEELRNNAVYTMKIQVEKDIGWITLDTKKAELSDDIAAFISVIDDTALTQEQMTLFVNVYFQKGLYETQEDFVKVSYNNEVFTFDITEGEQYLELELPHTNEPVLIQVISIIDEEETIVGEKTYTPTDYLHTSIELVTEGGLELVIDYELDTSQFEDVTYYYYIDGEYVGELIDNQTSILFENYGNTYQVDVYVSYTKQGETVERALQSYQFTTIEVPYYVLEYLMYEEDMVITLTVYDPYNEFQGAIADNGVSFDFELLYQEDGFKTFEVSVDSGIYEIKLQVNRSNPYAIVIETIGEE